MENKNIYQKLLEAQKEIGAIKKDSDNPFFKSKYVDINGILAIVKPILNKNGLVLTQGIRRGLFSEDHTASNGIETKIVNAENPLEEISNFCEIPMMSKPQETGSAITYFRRYALQSLLALETEDDDGNVASGNPKVFTPKSKGDKPKDDELPF